MIAKTRTSRHNNNGIAPLRDEIKELKGTIVADAKDIADGGARVARSAVSAANSAVGRVVSRGRERVTQASDAVCDSIRERPVTWTLAAAATGAALAAAYFTLRRKG